MANKKYTIEVSVTKEQYEAIANCKPTHKRGKDEGSFNACKTKCGYAFCGGKENYNDGLYKKGQFLFMAVYEDLLKDKDFPSDAPKADKPTSTSRGKNKGAKISETDEELFKQFLEFKKFMANK